MKNLYKSLAKFQKEVKNIPKNSKGYGYDYAKLEDIIRIVTPTLNKNGLVLKAILLSLRSSLVQ